MEYTEVYAWGSDQFGQLGLGRKQTGRTYSSPRICSFSIIIRKLSCGEEHACFISKAGHVYSMGNNYEGRLGLGDKSIIQSSSPCLLESLLQKSILDVACGGSHSLALSSDGQCFAWGLGEFGALGIGSYTSAWKPTNVKIPLTARKIFAGSRHSAAITENGKVFMWGASENAQLASTSNKVKVPTKLKINGVKEIALGNLHTLFLLCNGQVWAVGGNSSGQLGLGDTENRQSPCKVLGLDHVTVKKIAAGTLSAAISDDGELFVWGRETLTPTKFNTENRVSSVSLGNNFGIILDENFNVFSWGNNSKGELGHGDCTENDCLERVKELENKKVQDVQCGGSFCICLGEILNRRPRSATPSRKASESRTSDSRGTSRDFDNQMDSFRELNLYKAELQYLKKQIENDSFITEQLKSENKNLKIENSQLKEKAHDDSTIIDRLRQDVSIHENNSERIRNAETSPMKSYSCFDENITTEKAPGMHFTSKRYFEPKEEKIPGKNLEEGSILYDPSMIEALKKEVKELYSENSELKERLSLLKDTGGKSELSLKLSLQLDENKKIKDEFTLKLADYQQKLDEQSVKYRQLESDFLICSSHNKRLEGALEQTEHKLIESKLDKDKTSFEEASKNINLSSQIEIQAQEITRLQHLLEQTSLSLLNSENTNAELNQLITRLKEENENETRRLKIITQDWEMRYNQVCNDNYKILETKSHDLAERNQSTALQRAREYREKTLYMLNGSSKDRGSPYRSISSSVRPPSRAHSPALSDPFR